MLLAIAVLVVSLVAVGLAIAGCLTTLSSNPRTSGQAPSATTPAASIATEGPIQTLEVPSVVAGVRSTPGASLSSKPRAPLAVGDCLGLGGTAEKVECGGGIASYRVVGTAHDDRQCPKDVDQSRLAEDGPLCLDIDWVVGGCMDLHDEPKHIDCATQGATTGVRVLGIIQGTTDVNSCPTGKRGIVYDERRFVVCVAVL
ncbi:LppU family putative lipoprotein [Nocardia brasiliensis]|uniref:LppU family putative lipoprotein n=1 Tax=Nocardia brasiliensis TaxID=37326 RepID=UPI003CC7F4B5